MNLPKRWAEYLLGNALAWIVWTLLLFASGLAVRLLLGFLEDTFGSLPNGGIIDAVVGYLASLPFAAGGALALVLAFAFLRRPFDDPRMHARLEAEDQE